VDKSPTQAALNTARPSQQVRELRNFGRDPPRFVLEYQFEKSETEKAYPSYVEDHCKS